jgi:hypothetical protein
MALGMRDGTNFGRGDVIAPTVLAAYLVVESAIIALLALRPSWVSATTGHPHRIVHVGQLAAGVLRIGFVGPIRVVDVDVPLFALLFTSIAVAMLCSTPQRWRLPMALWSIAVWLGTLLAFGCAMFRRCRSTPWSLPPGRLWWWPPTARMHASGRTRCRH